MIIILVGIVKSRYNKQLHYGYTISYVLGQDSRAAENAKLLNSYIHMHSYINCLLACRVVKKSLLEVIALQWF